MRTNVIRGGVSSNDYYYYYYYYYYYHLLFFGSFMFLTVLGLPGSGLSPLLIASPVLLLEL